MKTTSVPWTTSVPDRSVVWPASVASPLAMLCTGQSKAQNDNFYNLKKQLKDVKNKPALQTIGSVSRPKLFPLSQVLVSVDPVAGVVPVLHANVTVVPWSTDVAVEPGTLMPVNPVNEHPV